MANETEIQPALGAGEWRGGMHWTATSLVLARYVPDSGRGMRENVGGFEIRVNAEGILKPQGPRAIAEFTDRDAHSIAALALYGQPFGFTHDDVSAIEDAAHEIVALNEDSSQRNAAERHAAELRSIAARIAALLPPHP